MNRVRGQRSDSAIRLRILLRGIRSRRASAVVLFVVSTLAIAAAAIGPVFLSAGDTSILSSAFASAPVGESDILVLANGGSNEYGRLVRAADDGVRHAGGLLERPIVTAGIGSSFVGAQNQGYQVELLARYGLCAHLHFGRGGCPAHPNEVAISGRSARAARLAVGSHVRLGGLGLRGATPVRVVGIYRRPPSVETRYWGGTNYFPFGTGGLNVQKLDPFVASFATVLGYAPGRPRQLSADISWSPDASRAGAGALQTIASRTTKRIASDPALHASTGFAAIAAKATAGAHLMRSIVLAIVLQLVLLVLIVLYALAHSTAVDRRPEAQFARRHGFTRPAIFALAVGEPAALLVAALPVGLLVAWLVVAALGRTIFVHGTPVTLDLWSFVAAFGVCSAGVLTVALASFELWRRERTTRLRHAPSAEVALDACAVALALAGLLALTTRGSLDSTHPDALALLAPGLLALGVGVVALRLVRLAIDLGIRRTAGSSRIPSFLALRELGRRPAVLRQALPLAAAITVCLFAVGSYVRAASNRSLLAHFEVGAGRVVDVSVKPGFDLESAVRRADPSGRLAMAAVLYRSSYDRLLAVDSSRLAQVATWPHSLNAQAKAVIARRLSPPEPDAITIDGDALRLRIHVPPGTPALSLAVQLYDEVYGSTSTLEFGPIRPGTHVYSASLEGDCPGRCRVVSVSPFWENANERFSRIAPIALLGAMERTSGRTWRPVRFGVDGASSWKPEAAGARVEASPSGRGVVFAAPGAQLGGGGAFFVPASAAVHVPAVVTSGLEQNNAPQPPANTISLQDFDGNPLTAKVIATVPTLPQLGTNGALVDLRLADGALTGAPTDSTDQVWLSDAAGPDIVQRLRSMGVRVTATRRAAPLRSRLDHSGTALGYDLMLIVSPIAALLALGTIVFDIVSNGRRRRGELASLRMVGLRRRVLRRSMFLVNMTILVTALVVGVGVGLAALALALPSLPEFVSGTDLLPIPADVPVAPIAEAALGLALVFLVAAGSATWLVLTNRRELEAE